MPKATTTKPKRTIRLRPEDRAALWHAADLHQMYPELKLRLGWLRERLGATWDEVLEIRARLEAAGQLWPCEDDYTKPSIVSRRRA